jgi:hypothetical protein
MMTKYYFSLRVANSQTFATRVVRVDFKSFRSSLDHRNSHVKSHRYYESASSIHSVFSGLMFVIIAGTTESHVKSPRYYECAISNHSVFQDLYL